MRIPEWQRRRRPPRPGGILQGCWHEKRPSGRFMHQRAYNAQPGWPLQTVRRRLRSARQCIYDILYLRRIESKHAQGRHDGAAGEFGRVRQKLHQKCFGPGSLSCSEPLGIRKSVRCNWSVEQISQGRRGIAGMSRSKVMTTQTAGSWDISEGGLGKPFLRQFIRIDRDEQKLGIVSP